MRMWLAIFVPSGLYYALQENTRTKMIYIGIDPGVNTGLCLMESNTIYILKTCGIVEALFNVSAWKITHDITIIIEDARLRRGFKVGNERAQGAGSIKRDCSIWEEFCNKESIQLIKVPPQNTRTKLSPEAFAKITGYTKRTSNHARDAAMLVWGRK